MIFDASRFRSLWLSLIVALGVYFAFAFAADLGAVKSAAARVGALIWMAVLSLSLFNYGLRFLRWHTYLCSQGHRVPLGASAGYYLSGFALTTTPAKAGEALRSVYLKRHGVSYTDSLAALFAERVVDVMAMIALALAALTVYRHAWWLLAALAGLVGVIMFGVDKIAMPRWLAGSNGGTSSNRWQQMLAGLGALFQAAAGLLRGRLLVFGITLGLLAWVAEGYGLFLILGALDAPVPLGLSVSIYALGILVGAASMIPGGLGSTEAAITMLLLWQGTEPATAIAATLICRLATLWFAVALGIGAVGSLAWLAPTPAGESQ